MTAKIVQFPKPIDPVDALVVQYQSDVIGLERQYQTRLAMLEAWNKFAFGLIVGTTVAVMAAPVIVWWWHHA